MQTTNASLDPSHAHETPTMSFRVFWVLLLVTMAFQGFFTHYMLDPTIGIDDANITQAYARHFAQGHGFVYNIGGERVEGATSLLWTLVNAAAFLTSDPIGVITVLSILITTMTVLMSAKIAIVLSSNVWAGVVVVCLFNLFSYYFAWNLWSLMDTGLFILMIVFLSYVVADPSGQWRYSLVLLCGLLLPIIRPEGIIVAVAVAGFMVLARRKNQAFLRLGVLLAVMSLVSFGALTLWRLQYFGYPFPNTFYAKVSLSTIGQVFQGLEYLLRVISYKTNAVLLLLFLVLGPYLMARNATAQSTYVYFVMYMLVGAVTVYTLLGGDHFSGSRFYQFLIPLMLPLFGICLAPLFSAEWSTPVMKSMGVVGFMVVALVSTVPFMRDIEGFRIEYRIAESGFDVGTRLNEVGTNYSVATVPAGAIRMAFDGKIYDTLGLNWVKMAHAEADIRSNVPKNHGGFVREVFDEAMPDLAFARTGDCEDGKGRVLSAFRFIILNRLETEQRFREAYEGMCGPYLVFFARRELVPDLVADGYKVYPRALPDL